MQANAQTRIQSVTSIKPQTVAGVVNGASIDTLGFSEARVAIHAGDISATGTTTVALTESDDNTTFVAVATATVSLANADDNSTKYWRIQLHKRKRYLRLETSVAAGSGLVTGTIDLTGSKDTRYFTNTYAIDLHS